MALKLKVHDFDNTLKLGFFTTIALVAVLFAYLLHGFLGVSFFWVALPVALGITALLAPLIWATTGSISTLLASFLWPSGGDRLERDFSEQDALIVRGQYRDAADSFRSHLVAFPADNSARIRLAELLKDRLDDRPGAISLLKEARSLGPSRSQARPDRRHSHNDFPGGWRNGVVESRAGELRRRIRRN